MENIKGGLRQADGNVYPMKCPCGRSDCWIYWRGCDKPGCHEMREPQLLYCQKHLREEYERYDAVAESERKGSN